MRKAVFSFLIAFIAQTAYAQSYPAAPDFDVAGSDAKAIEIADTVMRRQGGWENWDKTQYVKWTFFNRRTLLWDKWSGWVRIDWKDNSRNIIVNIHSGAGKVKLKGVEQTHPDSLKKFLEIGKRVWINDSYWLCMPFKLKDSGVTLKYLGDTTATADGRAAHLLQMTFKGVGVTPDNKYHIWVDKETELVSQWAFFKKFDDIKPDFVNAWTGYRDYGKVKLSEGRGEGKGMTEIETPETVPPGIFEKF